MHANQAKASYGVMTSLAEDLLRRSQGWKPTISKTEQEKESKLKTVRRDPWDNRPRKLYLDEDGNPTRRYLIAKKYNISTSKVTRLMEKYERDEAYRLMSQDGRKQNGRRPKHRYSWTRQDELYLINNAKNITAKEAAERFGRSTCAIYHKVRWLRENGHDIRFTKTGEANHLAKHSARDVEMCRQLREEGETLDAIAKTMEIPMTTVQAFCEFIIRREG